MKIKSFVKAFIVILFAVFGLAMVFGITLFALNASPGREMADSVSFTIKRGDNLNTISRKLEEGKLIRSSFFFTHKFGCLL